MNAPCYKCEKRTPGCHTYCEEYNKYNQDREEFRKKKKEQHRGERDFQTVRKKHIRKDERWKWN